MSLSRLSWFMIVSATISCGDRHKSSHRHEDDKQNGKNQEQVSDDAKREAARFDVSGAKAFVAIKKTSPGKPDESVVES